MNQIKKICTAIQSDKGIGWILAAAGIGIFLLLTAPYFSASEKKDIQTDTDTYFSVRFYTENLEERIAALCRQVHGVNEAHVLLTLEGGSEYKYAESISGAARDYIITENADGESPVLVQEIYPQIRGVAVVCTRGDDSSVQLTLTQLLSAALGIPASRIRVAGC